MTDAHLFLYILLPLASAVAAFLVYTQVIQPKQEAASHAAHVFGETLYPNGNPPAEAVVIGPTLWDGDHSTGMPQHPTPHPSGVGWTIRFPKRGQGKVDYLGFPTGPLTGKTRMAVDYELTLVGDAKVEATPQPDLGDNGGPYSLQMTSFFEEDGDPWTGAGKFDSYRQYYDGETHYLKPGANTMDVSLAGAGWNGVSNSTYANDPAGFNEAIAKTYASGVVFGGNGIGIGHGGDDTGTEPGSYAELWVKSIVLA